MFVLKRGTFMKLAILMVAATLFWPLSGHAQPTDKRIAPPSVTASGEAVITVEPDQAEIDIGVVTQAKNALDAARENADRLARVVAEIKKNLGKGDEAKTASYSLNPNYRYPQGGKPELVGYTATNILRVRTVSLGNVGKLIDSAMQAGANTIHRLVFNLKDEQAAQLQALRLASSKAKAKAQAMAEALGLRVVTVLSVVEGDRGVRPIMMAQARGAQMEAFSAAPTPVEAGTVEVRSSVTLTGELGPR
jgi:uncharacterized protein YggE